MKSAYGSACLVIAASCALSAAAVAQEVPAALPPPAPPVVETAVPAVKAFCHKALATPLGASMEKAVGEIYAAADVAGVPVTPDPEVMFAAPVKVTDDVTALTGWSICLLAPTTALSAGGVPNLPDYEIVTLPATTLLSTTCTVDAASACENPLAKYMTDKGYVATRYWRLTTSAAGVVTITVAVAPITLPGG